MAKSTYSDRVLDRRVVERNVRRGLLTDKDLQKHLKELHDAAPLAEQMKIDEVDEKDNGAHKPN